MDRRVRPDTTPATHTAAAPVPHAIVAPLPRSHVRTRTAPAEHTSTKWAFVRSGKAG